ncbi:hypothetical protein KSP39_PZI002472 [Platanthera zijinensis]|uniref:Uncharacterized protein n=1 Tax=Platanthera zijinensis TaxID=2320716 RepID=A0AAP0C0L3_9ASPA
MAAVRECSRMLDAYCRWIGQRVNMAKSMVMESKAMPRWKVNRFAHNLGYRKVEEFDYLGVKLAMRKLTKSDFSSPLIKWQTKIRGSSLVPGWPHCPPPLLIPIRSDVCIDSCRSPPGCAGDCGTTCPKVPLAKECGFTWIALC